MLDCHCAGLQDPVLVQSWDTFIDAMQCHTSVIHPANNEHVTAENVYSVVLTNLLVVVMNV